MSQEHREHLNQLLKQDYELLKEYTDKVYKVTSGLERVNAERERDIIFARIKKLEQELADLNKPAPSPAPPPQPKTSKFADLVPEFSDGMQRLDFAEELLKCDAISNPQKRAQVISLLPNQIQHSISASDAPKLHVSNIVNACDQYENGVARLLEAVHRIEGDTKAWGKLVTYLQGLAQ